MNDHNDLESVRTLLVERLATLDDPREILRAPELKSLYARIRDLDSSERSAYGQAVNDVKVALEAAVTDREAAHLNADVEPIDVSAPWDPGMGPERRPSLLSSDHGSVHPMMSELEAIIDIFTRMGFMSYESRALDDDFHMFGSLNFSDGHPARDGYDTFRTTDGLIAPAHTSTMQHRILREGRESLEAGGQIAAISYGRVFRNEDLDPTHEHTFYQVEGVFVSRSATLGEMLGTLQSFFQTYYAQALRIKTQPAYFPFVEPGLEFLIQRPASLGGKNGSAEGSDGDWLEMLGCGMIHPNVLSQAGIDPTEYRGFAWGGGVDRLVMLKYGIEDVRHFESGKLAFLKEFA